MAGISEEDATELLNITQLTIGSFPFRYLRVPLLSSRLNVCHYAPLLDKIEDLISAWKSKSLSYAGRLELIRSVIGGTLGFWMALFTLPQSVSSRIEAICRCFLWGKNPSSSYRPLIVWREVCRLTRCGSLNVLSLRTWNKALLVKYLWNIHSEKKIFMGQVGESLLYESAYYLGALRAPHKFRSLENFDPLKEHPP